MLGEFDSALAHWTIERDIEAGLCELDPENISWRRDLAATQMRIADLLRSGGDARRALKVFDGAERLLAGAVAKDPKRTSWVRDLAVLKTRKARALLAAGHQTEALRYADEGVAALDTMANYDAAARMRLLCDALLVSGDVHYASGDRNQANADWRRAAAVIEPYAVASLDPLVRDLWARSLLRIGRHDEAKRVVQDLRRAGYRNRDLEALCTENDC
jgi:tetratricopeptide (TPR) repeat protein